MFCSNCGKQLPDNAKFCNFCGAQQEIVKNTSSAPQTNPISKPSSSSQQQTNPISKPSSYSQQQTNPIKQQNSYSQQQTDNEPPKKKSKILYSIIIIVICFIIGSNVGKCISSSFVDDTLSRAEESSRGTLDIDNPAYDNILNEAGIIRIKPIFIGMDVEQFITKNSDGSIHCIDYGYKNDIVKSWDEVLYIPVSNYTDEQKIALENTQKATFYAYDALNCCVVTYNMGVNYFTISLSFSNVDKEENYKELYDIQLIKEKTKISMSKTEKTLISDGYIKK